MITGHFLRRSGAILLLCAGALLCGCTNGIADTGSAASASAGDTPDDESTTDTSALEVTSAVTAVTFSGSTASFSLTGLENRSVYLVRMNASASATSASSTGSLVSGSLSPSSGTVRGVLAGGPSRGPRTGPDGGGVSGQFGSVIRLEHRASNDFNARPPAPPPGGFAEAASLARAAASRNAVSDGSLAAASPSLAASEAVTGASLSSPAVGDGKSFWVDCTEGSSTGWKQVAATLRGQGDSCNVWIADAYYGDSSATGDDDTLTSSQAAAIAATFDRLYPVETNLFGFEYGGGTGGDGGMDGDSRINILLYDIDFDWTSGQDSGVVGYFWSKDCYTQDYIDSSTSYSGYKSNESEIFYIDSHFADSAAGVMYSTLAHEFQHMIDFNTKYIVNGTYASTWYNEMLSLAAEDLLSDKLEEYLGDGYSAGSDGPIAGWMPLFNYCYDQIGVASWPSSSSPGYSTSVYYAYASACAFGAYLTRNYGGAALVHSIASNALTDEESISAALAEQGGAQTAFAAAFARYGEALVYSSSSFSDGAVPEDLNTFDRTVTAAVGEVSYTAAGFDLMRMENYTGDGSTGPVASSVQSAVALDGYGLALQTRSSWQDVTGSLSITLRRPSSTGVSLYLMVR